MDKVAGSGNDEFYTPEYAITPLLKYVDPSWKVLCPFDTDDSNFVKMLRAHGCTVLNSHIDNGMDFFDFEYVGGVDAVISNPPYSVKTEVFAKLFQLGVPFAMLVGVVGLFESQKRFEMFRDNPFEVMYMNRRISYFKSYDDPKPSLNPPFSSVYLCKGLLPDRIVFEEIDKAGATKQETPQLF